MNKKIALPVIAMVAVIMGIGAFAPALATPADENDQHKMDICHFSEEKRVDTDNDPETGDENGNDATQTAGWELINVDNAGKAKGHFDKDGNARHVDPVSGEGDKPIDDSDTPADGTISTEACNALPSPEIIPDP